MLTSAPSYLYVTVDAKDVVGVIAYALGIDVVIGLECWRGVLKNKNVFCRLDCSAAPGFISDIQRGEILRNHRTSYVIATVLCWSDQAITLVILSTSR